MDVGASQAGVGKPVEVVLEAVVIRADGTTENLGVVSYWHRNPLKRIWYRVKQHFAQRPYRFMEKAK